MVLSLGAILLYRRRPAIALLLFALALLAKPFAASALFVVALFDWLGRGSAEGGGQDIRARAGWGLAAVAVVIGFGVAEALAFSLSAGLAPPLYSDPLVRGGMIFSVALRYGLMAVSGTGLSTFHEPAPVASLVDPWFLGGVLLIGLLGWRVVFCLRARRQEAAYWIWAAIGFAPLSGIVALPYPMADRYLYFILPGLIGGALLAGQAAWPALEARLGSGRGIASLRAGLFGGAIALLCLLGFISYQRASVFLFGGELMADAETELSQRGGRQYAQGQSGGPARRFRGGPGPPARRSLPGATTGWIICFRIPPMHPCRTIPSLCPSSSRWPGIGFSIGASTRPEPLQGQGAGPGLRGRSMISKRRRGCSRGGRPARPIGEALYDDAEALHRELGFRLRLEAKRAEAEGSGE